MTARVAGRKAMMGALTLYLDFINLFLFMLRFSATAANAPATAETIRDAPA